MTVLRKLSALLTEEQPVPDIEVTDLVSDSRQVTKGSCFIALSGSQTHGMEYAKQAVERGALVIVADVDNNWTQEKLAKARVGVPVIGVDQLSQKIGDLAVRYYRNPSESMELIGYTGTNGKSSCVWITASAMKQTAMISTLGNGLADNLKSSSHTTPDAIRLQRLYADFLAQGIERIAMEVSSHALAQGRVDSSAIDIAVFTNLSRDHLDYHKTMDAYGSAKAKLFQLPSVRHAVINVDDEFGHELVKKMKSDIKLITYSRHQQADLWATAIQLDNKGIKANLHWQGQTEKLNSPLFGKFNIENLLAVTGALLSSGLELQQIVKAFADIKPVPGRMELFRSSASPLIVVDYAHTPDALKKALEAARAHCQGKLVLVFGCGGDRDKGKRPLMGSIAESFADLIIVTDDNPRSEDAKKIIEDILTGMNKQPQIQRDRKTAIHQAITTASENDIVLIAGKGHESTQIIGNNVINFSDRDVVNKYLQEVA